MVETPASLLYQPNQKLRRSGTNTGAIVAAQSSECSLQISESWHETCSATGIQPSLKLGMGTEHLSLVPGYSSTQKSATLTVLYLLCEHFQVFRALKPAQIIDMCLSYCVQIFSNSGGVSLWDMVQLKDPEVRAQGAEQRAAATA